MHDTAKVPRKPDGDGAARRPLVDEQLADELLGKAQAEGVELLGPDGLLSQVTKAVLERALAEEMEADIRYVRAAGGARSSLVVLGRVCVADSAAKVRYRTQIWSSSGPM